MSDQKFYKCRLCGNFVSFIHNSGSPLTCCGEKMQEMVPNTSEGATEKHIPVIKIEGNTVTVTVGSTLHPMTEEHYIDFIYIHTEKGGQRKKLEPKAVPTAVFELVDDKLIEAFAYCNLHGMWTAVAK